MKNNKSYQVFTIGNSSIGKSSAGKSFMATLYLCDLVYEQFLIDTHFSNNNWLKRHGKTKIRKGHPLYSKCKSLKNKKPFDIFVSDPQHEFDKIRELLQEKEPVVFENGDRMQIIVKERS